ncbi:hypothetical protein PROPEN_04978 [Proteus penneri ATCC 35198]|nr:hypothetical protein PROPEN_04978 [Proteus penneri ATCC 35198]
MPLMACLRENIIKKSALGAILNEASDVISDIALYLPFAFIFPQAYWWIMLALFLMIMTEFLGVLAQTIHASRRYDGPMGKSDRAFIFGTIALFYRNIPLTDIIRKHTLSFYYY